MRIQIRIRAHKTDKHETVSLEPAHFIVVSSADQVDLVDLIMNQNPSTSSSAHQEEVDNLSGKILSGSMDLQPPSSTSSPSKRGKGAPHTIVAYFFLFLRIQTLNPSASFFRIHLSIYGLPIWIRIRDRI
jgi:hypothetical protein